MKDIVTLAKERADFFGVRNVVIASIDAGANLVCDIFGTHDYLVIAVGNIPEEKEERLKVQALCRKLEDRGAKVLLEECSLFQAMDRGKDYRIGDRVRSFQGGHYDGPVSLNEVIEKAGKDAEFGAVEIIYRTIQNLFGDGPRMCIEVALMAADSGLLPLDADCIVIDRPSPKSNCPHAAMVLKPCRTDDILMRHAMRVKDLALAPGPEDHWFTDGPTWVG